MRLKVKYLILLSYYWCLTAVENKISSASTLVKKTAYNTEINEIEKKITGHIIINILLLLNLINLWQKFFAVRLKRANLANKSDIVNLVGKTDFDEKLKNLNKNNTTNETKNVLVENEF